MQLLLQGNSLRGGGNRSNNFFGAGAGCYTFVGVSPFRAKQRGNNLDWSQEETDISAGKLFAEWSRAEL